MTKKPAKAPSRAVAVHQPQPTASMQAANALSVIIGAARDKNMPVEKLERLYAMQKEREQKEERFSFDEAMRAAQAEMPAAIGRDTKGERGQYAKLEKIAKIIKPIYVKHGFVLSFGTANSALPGHYKVVCNVSHTGGHSREYTADVPTDATGPKGEPNKTGIQGFGSAMSYARRYLTVLIFNITIADHDDDGEGGRGVPDVDASCVSPKQLDKITAMLLETKSNVPVFLDMLSKIHGMAIESPSDIPSALYDQAIAKLEQKRGMMAAK